MSNTTAKATLTAIFVGVLATCVPNTAYATGETIATFEGETIDLSEGWGEAAACDVGPAGVTCYRTEVEMDAALAAQVTLSTDLVSVHVSLGGALVSLLSTCGSDVRLYSAGSYGGTVLNLNLRGVPISLAAYGFDNLTSSYKIGACSAEFYSGYISGPYPGSTSPGVQSPSMLSGWDNVVSSVYIY